MPDSLEIIEKHAFQETQINNLHIRSNVKKIDVMGCLDSLHSITVSKENQNYLSIDGVLYDKNITRLIKYPAKKQGARYIVPNSVRIIVEEAFYFSNLLESIELPTNLKVIGNDAFKFCKSLKSIQIPGDLQRIGHHAFCCCDAIECLIIPGQVKTIEEGLFSNCIGLKHVIIEDGIVSIKKWAFEECRALEEIIIPDTVKNMDRIFWNCRNLKKVIVKKDSDAYIIACKYNYPVCYMINGNLIIRLPLTSGAFLEGNYNDTQIANNKVSGNGIMYYGNGERFEGEIVDNEMIRGTLYWSNETSWTGVFHNSEPFNGKGIWKFNDGTVKSGEWINGKYR